MGSLLEALWVYFINSALLNEGSIARDCEIAWLEDHEPNDFACVHRDADWLPGTRYGELFRVEAKSMNKKSEGLDSSGVAEPKPHFTELQRNIGDYDQLLVLVWTWEKVDAWRVYPKVVDFIICPSKPIAAMRDVLHIRRGGSFVEPGSCPDHCSQALCKHIGEPINEAGVRERISGPDSTKGEKVSAAANFGGLVRMLKTSSPDAKTEFREQRNNDSFAHDFISFIHKNFDDEEYNQYSIDEWKKIALTGMGAKASIRGLNKPPLVEWVRSNIPNYRDLLRDTF